MIELTEEQCQGLAGAEPIVVDPRTHEESLLVRNHVYKKFRGLLDDDARLMYPMLAHFDPEDWEDAASYQEKPRR
jgi:hypothetical protein